MDTRSRKRRRGDRTPREKDDREDEVNIHDDTSAILPEYRPSTSYFASRTSLVTGSCSSSHVPRQFNTNSNPFRGRSPSPARMFRQREQSELQLLNERLSSHSEHVKQLQAENVRLKLQLEAMDGVIKRETSNIKILHGEEIKALQNLLDKSIEEKCHAETECDKLQAEVVNLQQQLKDRDIQVTSLTENLEGYKKMSSSHSELQFEFDAVKTALNESVEDVKRLNVELLKEKRTNKRLVEESTLNKDRYLKEVEEASGRFSQHMQKADERLEEGYETFVADALASVREQHIRDLNLLREELTTTYQHKLVEWKTKCETAQADLVVSKRENKASKLGYDKLKDAVTQFKADRASLEVQLQESRDRLDELKESSERERCQAQREVALLKQELSEVKAELEEISGANMRLETEINAYRHIVEDLEEQSPSKRRSASKTSKPQGTSGETPTAERNQRTTQSMTNLATVRHTFFRTNEFDVGLGVLDLDSEGKYVTLVNNTDHPIDLCLWRVQQSNENGENVKYEITGKQLLDHGMKLTIWSSDVHHVTDVDDDDSSKDVTLDTDNSDETTDTLHVGMCGKSWLKLNQLIIVRVEDGDGQLQAKCQFNVFKDRNITTDTPYEYPKVRRTRCEDTPLSSSSNPLRPQPVISGSTGNTAIIQNIGKQDKDGCRVM